MKSRGFARLTPTGQPPPGDFRNALRATFAASELPGDPGFTFFRVRCCDIMLALT